MIKNLLPILLLLILTVILNTLIFSSQLNYGFRDVDWQVLYYFKLYDGLSFDYLPQAFKVLGVYISEAYYVGILEKFFGLNFALLYQVTHFFKIIAAISVYIMVLKIFKSKLVALITSLIYTVSYTHAGVLFQLSSGGYFLTTIFMSSFLTVYYFSLKGKNILRWSIISGFLLILTIILKPERMFPLIPLITTVEFINIALRKFKKNLIITSLKRTLMIFLPLVIVSFLYIFLLRNISTVGFTSDQFFVNSNIRIDYITKGNWQLVLYPFASLGSIFLYEDYWKLLGQLNFQNFGVYIYSLILGPIFRLGGVTLIFFSLLFGKSFKLTLVATFTVFIFALIIYALNINWQGLSLSERIHFDANLTAIPAIFGFYILLLNFIFFIKWIQKRDPVFVSLILGITFAFLFILMTWIASDIQLIFMGPQRYLSFPSIGTSLFIAGVMFVLLDKLSKIKFVKQFAWLIFLFLLPLVLINYQVANKFFENELTTAGLRGSDQVGMKDKFHRLVREISKDEPSLFYFDETQDKDNGYFNEGTIEAGFEYWTRINPDGTLNNFPNPGMIRTNIQCPEHTHQNCVDILKKGLSLDKGELGIWYKDTIRGNIPRFYKLNNFYAIRFINKDLVNIREEILKQLGVDSP